MVRTAPCFDAFPLHAVSPPSFLIVNTIGSSNGFSVAEILCLGSIDCLSFFLYAIRSTLLTLTFHRSVLFKILIQICTIIR
jgi:hypothetical protein